MINEAGNLEARLAEIKTEGGTLKEILFNVAMLAPPPKTGTSLTCWLLTILRHQRSRCQEVNQNLEPSDYAERYFQALEQLLMLADRKDLTQREKVIIEIMTSEQVFVTGLRIMKEAYLVPMREKAEKSKHSMF